MSVWLHRIEPLLSPGVSPSSLECAKLTKSEYEAVVQERRLMGLCEYPICAESHFSKQCRALSTFYLSQLDSAIIPIIPPVDGAREFVLQRLEIQKIQLTTPGPPPTPPVVKQIVRIKDPDTNTLQSVKPNAESKPFALPPLSPFGKVWSRLSNLVTPATCAYFNNASPHILPKEDATLYTRRDIFSKRMLVLYSRLLLPVANNDYKDELVYICKTVDHNFLKDGGGSDAEIFVIIQIFVLGIRQRFDESGGLATAIGPFGLAEVNCFLDLIHGK